MEQRSEERRTNEGLRAERDRADEELLDRSQLLAEDADAVVARARERARQVLALTRAHQDAQLDALAPGTPVRASVDAQRAVVDDALASERAAIDAARLDERERRRLALLQLLALERDVTDRALADERAGMALVEGRAAAAVAAGEDTLGQVAHDLRGMIAALVMNATTITLSAAIPVAIAAAERLLRLGSEMAAAVEDLVDFAALRAGAPRLARARVDLVELAREVVEIHAPAAKANRLVLEAVEAPGALVAEVDAGRLRRVLMNLLANALKFAPPGAHVRVTVAARGELAELAVTNEGTVIPPDQREAIFEPFHRGAETSGRAPGAGLGLHIARQIVQAHGGRIWAESSDAHGTTLRLELPLAAVT